MNIKEAVELINELAPMYEAGEKERNALKTEVTSLASDLARLVRERPYQNKEAVTQEQWDLSKERVAELEKLLNQAQRWCLDAQEAQSQYRIRLRKHECTDHPEPKLGECEACDFHRHRLHPLISGE